MRRTHGRHLAQSGQALIELAFVVPLLLILLLGVIEVGRYAYIAILVGNAAHAGASYGAQSKQQSNDTTGIQNAAYFDFAGGNTSSSTNNSLAPGTLTITSSTSCGCDSGGATTAAPSCDITVYSNAGTCAGTSRWVVVVNVTANGTFTALFNYPGIPSSLVISRSASLPVT